ncbi:hypothetical protein AB6E53_02205 [Vibrio breoganii]|uniref:Uncharacterized protein n=1 Tax=Vibrio breoganii TaxID=553239 RepID=A0AAP8MVQ9_9VIBR|nr:hypothetical protein [Vibrio breoganii]PMP10200.1 hypothetical protein BCS93_11025 [Vibrio breoganii]
MSGLDTRGFMDGALRGFSVMERHQQNKKQNERRDRLEAQNDYRYREGISHRDERTALEDERYQGEIDYRTETDEENKRRWQLEFDRNKEKDALAVKEHNLRVKNLGLRNETEKVKAKTAFIQENTPIIDNAWAVYAETGKIDPILENEYVKGGVYDPRRYTTEFISNAEKLGTKMQGVMSGEVDSNDSEFHSLMSSMYEGNLNKSVGQKDLTGKTIARNEIAHINFVEDVDPKMKGNQSGIVVGVISHYEDGTKSEKPKPITQNRSTDKNDKVMVIPIENAMADIQTQLKLSRLANTQFHNGKVFSKKDDGMRGELREALVGLEQEKAKAISKAQSDPMAGENVIADIEETYRQQEQSLRDLYAKPDAPQRPEQGGLSALDDATPSQEVITWANGNEQKLQFLQAIPNEYLANADSAYLETQWAKFKAHKTAERDEALVEKVKGDNLEQGASKINYSTATHAQLEALAQQGDQKAMQMLEQSNASMRPKEDYSLQHQSGYGVRS